MSVVNILITITITIPHAMKVVTVLITIPHTQPLIHLNLMILGVYMTNETMNPFVQEI
jgi:hypothetical protein